MTHPTAASEILAEAAPRLAEAATQSLYDEQPQLMSMGERGRAHTRQDFEHHFMALADLDPARFAEYVDYCEGLFEARGFPLRWLSDAWRHMGEVVEREMPAEVWRPAQAILQGVGAGAKPPRTGDSSRT